MPMTGKCELCERGRGRHTRRRAPVRARAPELRAPGRRLRSISGRPCATCVSSKPGYTLASEMKNYTERDAWFLLTILKSSLSLILGKILCLNIFPLWQTQPSRAGLKGFCPGQMVEHKNPADSRNNLKKREEISLNRYGSAKINGYSSSLDKTLLHFFFTTDLWCNWPRSVLGDLGQDSQMLGQVLKTLKPGAQPPCGWRRGRGGSGFG